MNKEIANGQLDRMKSLMNYGLKTENKQSYSSVEYQKVGADGKVYGIVREGAKYYIKSAPNKQNLVKEDFGYIGGFRNRKDNEYTSYANAQKNFDLKMISLKEAVNKENFNIQSWDLDKKEMVVTEASDKMKSEILRERQIMSNAMAIMEKKGAVCCDAPECPKDNIKAEKPETGDAKTADDTFNEDGEKKLPKEMNESEEVLGWNRKDPNYMDKSHGTEIGDSAPFDDATARNIDDQDKKVTKTGEMKDGVVEEGASMHDSDNQNTPTPGVGEIGDNQPFDGEKGKQIDEALDGIDGEVDDEEPIGDEGEDFGAEDELGGEELGDDLEGDELDDIEGEEGEIGDELDDEEFDDMEADSDLEDRISSMEDMLSQIAAKLGIGAPAVDADSYEDDELFDDEEEFEDEPDFGGDDLGGEGEVEDDEIEDCYKMESSQRKGVRIYETKAFRNAMRKQMVNEEGMTPFKDAGRVPQGNMNKLDDFGKHPAYQKKVMELPPKDMKEFPGNYDMNDDSVRSDAPYGEKIGDGAPFEIDPQAIDNAIAEAFDRLKKKSNRK